MSEAIQAGVIAVVLSIAAGLISGTGVDPMLTIILYFAVWVNLKLDEETP